MMSVETLEVIEAEQRPGKTLDEVLQSLVGLPFQLARLRYGDELTLQFGKLRESRHPKMKHLLYGEVEIAIRGSGWKWTAPAQSGQTIEIAPDAYVENCSFEQSPLTAVGSPIASISGKRIGEGNRRELHLHFEDGSDFSIIHDPDFDDGEKTLADWEMSTPLGFWDVWPDRPPTFVARGSVTSDL